MRGKEREMQMEREEGVNRRTQEHDVQGARARRRRRRTDRLWTSFLAAIAPRS